MLDHNKNENCMLQKQKKIVSSKDQSNKKELSENTCTKKENASKRTITLNPLIRALCAGLSLGGISTLCLLLVLYAFEDTKDLIEYNQNEAKIMLTAHNFMPEDMLKDAHLKCYLIDDQRVGKDMHLYSIVDNSPDENNRGYLMTYSTNRGYASPLVMIAAFDTNKKIIKTDVLISNETPGIGDKVQRTNSNFMDQFNGKIFDDTKWDVKKFNGDFDYISGSTVTSRAVVTATGNALNFITNSNLNELKLCGKVIK